ncbi:MAG TPA: hypothetical protein VII08_17640 [Myxococcales bacterium]
MSPKVLAVTLSLAACAGANRTGSKPDALRLSASHYQSMTGVALNTGLGPMTCSRGLITGSHILRWYCQFETDPTQYRLEAPILFVAR